MNKKKSTPEESAATEKENRQYKQTLRRRLIGAGVVFSTTLILWQLGSAISPAEQLQDTPHLPRKFTQTTPLTPIAPTSQPIDSAVTSYITSKENNQIDSFNELKAKINSIYDNATAEITQAEDTAAADETIASIQTEDTVEAEDTADEFIQEAIVIIEETDAEKSTTEGTNEATQKATAAKATIAAVSPPAVSGYVVQLGAFSKQAAAQAILDHIKRKKFDGRLQQTTHNGKVLWRVQAINFPTRNHAKQAQKRLAKIGYSDTQILSAEKK